MPSRTLPDFTTGTVTVTNGSRTVTGAGTGWTTTANGVTESTIAAGDMLIVGTGRPVMIDSVDSATQVTLVENWPNATASGTAYKIRRYVALPTGSVLAALQSVEARGTDTTPLTSYTVDGGTTRVKLRQATGGQGAISVGATGTADASLLDAILLSSTALVGIRGVPSEELDVIRAQNATTTTRVYNANTGASAVAEFLAQTGTANATLSLAAYDNAAAPYARIAAGSAATALNVDAAAHVWRSADGATERMRLNSTGLGVGTASPSYKLHVATAAGTAATAALATGSSAAASTLSFLQSGAVQWDAGITASAGDFQIAINGGQTAYSISRSGAAVNYHAFQTGGSERTRIDSSGNVGVGTSSPSKRVTIEVGNTFDGIRAVSTGAGSGGVPVFEGIGYRADANQFFGGRFAAAVRRADGTAIASTNKLGLMLFGGQWGTDTTYQSAKVLYPASIQGIAEGSFTSATAMPTGLAFFTGSTGDDAYTPNLNYGTERMRIDASGNVGIGTSSPGSKLTVAGGDVAINGGNAVLSGTTSYAPQIQIYNSVADGSSGYVIMGKGRAGNTTSLSGDNLGTILFQGRDTTNALTNAASIVALQESTSGSGTVPGGLYFATGGSTERLRIESGGATRPGADNSYTLGSSSYRWSVVYAATGTINTSDARLKTDVQDAALGLGFIEALRPVSYRWIEGGAVEVDGPTETVEEQVTDDVEITTTEIVVEDGKAIRRQVTRTEKRPVFDEIPVVDEDGNVCVDTVKEPVTEDVEVIATEIVMEDGKAIERRVTRIEKRQVFDVVPVVDEAGKPIITPAVVDPETGEETSPAQPATHSVPRMRTVEKPRMHRVPRMHTVEKPTRIMQPKPGGRTHYGLIAQEVKDALDAAGCADFAGWVLGDKDDPQSTQGLRYDQFIGPLIKAVQELAARVKALETA